MQSLISMTHPRNRKGSRESKGIMSAIIQTESRSEVSNSLGPCGLYSPWNSPGQNTGVGSLCLLRGIFPIQGSNSGLPHSRWILYQLSHQGSPRILKSIAYPFSRGSSCPGIKLESPAWQAGSLPTDLSGKPKGIIGSYNKSLT